MPGEYPWNEKADLEIAKLKSMACGEDWTEEKQPQLQQEMLFWFLQQPEHKQAAIQFWFCLPRWYAVFLVTLRNVKSLVQALCDSNQGKQLAFSFQEAGLGSPMPWHGHRLMEQTDLQATNHDQGRRAYLWHDKAERPRE